VLEVVELVELGVVEDELVLGLVALVL